MSNSSEAVRARLIELLLPFADEVDRHPKFVEWANFDTRRAAKLLDEAPTELLTTLVRDICPDSEDGRP